MAAFQRIGKFSRRKFLHLASGAAGLGVASRTAVADTYPSRPIRILVGFPAGGTPDLLARMIGQRLQERLGQPVIVEDRPGASSNVATEAVVRSAADGYTLLSIGSPNVINGTLYGPSLNYNFIRDIAPVAGTASLPDIVVVNPDFPAKTIPEFIAYAKANPGKVAMASAGNGTSGHMAGELFKMMAGVDLLHVPYRGGPPAVTDLLAGRVQVLFDVVTNSLELIRAGKLRALAVTSTARCLALPDVPVAAESCRASRRRIGRAWARLKACPPTSSKSSTARSTRRWPIPRTRPGSPIWVARRWPCRRPNSKNSSAAKPISGPRSSAPPISRRIDIAADGDAP